MNEIAALVAATLSAGTPLLLAAIGIVVSEKSGVVNLGIEGMMLVAAAAGFGAAHASGIPEVGFLAGATAGILLALLFAALTLGLLTNQYATGLALALFGAGISAFLGQALQGESLAPRSGDGIPGLRDIPVIGPALLRRSTGSSTSRWSRPPLWPDSFTGRAPDWCCARSANRQTPRTRSESRCGASDWPRWCSAARARGWRARFSR